MTQESDISLSGAAVATVLYKSVNSSMQLSLLTLAVSLGQINVCSVLKYYGVNQRTTIMHNLFTLTDEGLLSVSGTCKNTKYYMPTRKGINRVLEYRRLASEATEKLRQAIALERINDDFL